MPSSLKQTSLKEISQELARFNYNLRQRFLCPTCFCNFALDSKEITEEHIIPKAQGGKVSTFLCKDCNSYFGRNQTRWLSDWIELDQGGEFFHVDPKK